MITEKYKPNFLKARCTWKLILVHVYEKTVENSNYVFSSVDISKAFGCELTAVMHMIRRSASFGDYVKIDNTKKKPYYFRITNFGKLQAKKLLERQVEADMNGR